MVHLEYIIWK